MDQKNKVEFLELQTSADQLLEERLNSLFTVNVRELDSVVSAAKNGHISSATSRLDALNDIINPSISPALDALNDIINTPTFSALETLDDTCNFSTISAPEALNDRYTLSGTPELGALNNIINPSTFPALETLDAMHNSSAISALEALSDRYISSAIPGLDALNDIINPSISPALDALNDIINPSISPALKALDDRYFSSAIPGLDELSDIISPSISPVLDELSSISNLISEEFANSIYSELINPNFPNIIIPIPPTDPTHSSVPEPDLIKVVIVGGYNRKTNQAVARFVEQFGFNAILLDEQPSGGRTRIEKLQAHANVDFAIVLLTSDDLGAPKR